MKKHRTYKIVLKILLIPFVVLVFAVGLYKTGVYRFDFVKAMYKKIDFKMTTKALSILKDALAFSVYDMEQEKYLFYEGDNQLPTVASLSKFF